MNAIASAKRRRAGITTVDPQNPSTSTKTNTPETNTSQSTTGLTIHQVVALFDKRITLLEKTIATFMSATTDETTSFNTATCSNNTTNQDPNVVEEMQTNILFLNSEIQTLKSTIIELQTYTTSVNKKLLEN